MRTSHRYGSRNDAARLINPQAKEHIQRWACDNPRCQKHSHYTPGCPNAMPMSERKRCFLFGLATGFMIATLLAAVLKICVA